MGFINKDPPCWKEKKRLPAAAIIRSSRFFGTSSVAASTRSALARARAILLSGTALPLGLYHCYHHHHHHRSLFSSCIPPLCLSLNQATRCISPPSTTTRLINIIRAVAPLHPRPYATRGCADKPHRTLALIIARPTITCAGELPCAPATTTPPPCLHTAMVISGGRTTSHDASSKSKLTDANILRCKAIWLTPALLLAATCRLSCR